jgi:hypothetical protein
MKYSKSQTQVSREPGARAAAGEWRNNSIYASAVAPRTSRTLSMPRGICCADACKRLFLKLFTSLFGLHSQKSLQWREKLPVEQPCLALRKRNIQPDTATNVALRVFSWIIASCSCVSVALLRLPDTDKSVSFFHVTTSTCNSHKRGQAPVAVMFPASHGTRTTPARPHEVHSPIGPRPVPWANSAAKFTTSAGQRKLVAHGPTHKQTSKHFQMCLRTTICI